MVCGKGELQEEIPKKYISLKEAILHAQKKITVLDSIERDLCDHLLSMRIFDLTMKKMFTRAVVPDVCI